MGTDSLEAAELTTYNFNINAMESQPIQRPRKTKNTVKIKDLEDIEKDTNIMVERVTKKCDLPEDLIRHQYKDFMNLCPEGNMTKEKFLQLAEQALGGEASFLVDVMFRVFDDDHSGSIDFEEFILALNATKMTTAEEKLQWIFNVFDKDGGGSIDASEIHEMVVGLCTLSGIEVTKVEADQCTSEIMEAIDVDNDGDVTKEEFILNARKSDFIANLLEEGDDL